MSGKTRGINYFIPEKGGKTNKCFGAKRGPIVLSGAVSEEGSVSDSAESFVSVNHRKPREGSAPLIN